MAESDLITHPTAEVLVRVARADGEYDEAWVSAVDRLLAEDSEAPSVPPTV